MSLDKVFYITTPIYYVNDNLHLGHAYTTLGCDAISRWERLLGREVFFLTGTDEHGQKIEDVAKAKGTTAKAWADGIVENSKALWKELGVTYDRFIRTTDIDHEKVVQEFFKKLYEKGDIYKGEYEGWYCVSDESFFTETQLNEGKCPDCGREVSKLKEESYFFKLSKYAPALLKYYDENPDFIQPVSRRSEMVNIVKDDLKDLSVSRVGVKWGIPVPFDDKHTIYVWFDALLNYLTAAGYYFDQKKFERVWPADIHMVGKEILKFHSVIWPAMLMALEVRLPKKVFAHGWWTVEGDKMSKSKGNIIDPRVFAQQFGVEPLRYFVLREVPFGLDGDFSQRSFTLRYNGDLANDLGNLLNRTLTMVEKSYEGVVPTEFQSDMSNPMKEINADLFSRVQKAMDRVALDQALEEIFKLVGRANKYIEESAPWTLLKQSKNEDHKAVMYNLCETLRLTAVYLKPFIPATALSIWKQLGLTQDFDQVRLPESGQWGLFPKGIKVQKGQPLFPRMESPRKT